MELLFKRLGDHDLQLPERGSEFAVGLDLRANAHAEIEPGERCLVKTGFAVMIPAGHYGRIAPRSGLSYKHGISVLAGVIDIDYRGELGVVLHNSGSENFVIERGDRIAQLITEACGYPSCREVDDLPDTARGDGGYGGTGVK